MTADPKRIYQQQATTTASPAQLVLTLYDAAIAAVERAHTAAVEQPDGWRDTLHRESTQAQRIVTELAGSLNHDAGEIAENLAALYGFCLDRLVESNVRKADVELDAVRSTLQTLRDAFDDAARQVEP